MASFNHIDWCESFGPYLASDCSCPCPCEWDQPCRKHDEYGLTLGFKNGEVTIWTNQGELVEVSGFVD